MKIEKLRELNTLVKNLDYYIKDVLPFCAEQNDYFKIVEFISEIQKAIYQLMLIEKGETDV